MFFPQKLHPRNSVSRPCRLHVERLQRCFIEVWDLGDRVKLEQAEFSSRTHFSLIRFVPCRMGEFSNQVGSLLSGFLSGLFFSLGQQKGHASGHHGVTALLPLLLSIDPWTALISWTIRTRCFPANPAVTLNGLTFRISNSQVFLRRSNKIFCPIPST